MHTSVDSARPSRRRLLFSGLVPILTLAASPALATDWLEPRDNDLDAGELVANAQITTGIGQIDGILGHLDAFLGFAGNTGSDRADIFAINIVDPVNFTARGVSLGSGDFDTNVYLFNAGAFGLLSNRNQATFNLFPGIDATADDGTFTLTTPGIYYLAVTGGDIDAVSGATLPIFNYAPPTEVSGPDGPGGTLPHNAWAGTESYGTYRIELTGVHFIPAPGAGVMLLGLLGLRRASRR